MALQTVPFDASEFLDTADSQADLVADAFDTGNAAYIAQALGVVAKARGMSAIAREAGVTREALYKSLSENGDPKASTLLGVAKALGYRIIAEPIEDQDDPPRVKGHKDRYRERIAARNKRGRIRDRSHGKKKAKVA